MEVKRKDAHLVSPQEDDFVARDDFEDADQLRIGNDGIFMLTFFSKFSFVISPEDCWKLLVLLGNDDKVSQVSDVQRR